MNTHQPPAPKLTRASSVAADLRAAILNGDLAPGAPINLDKLRGSLGVSLSPLREAVSRLIADGLVEMEDQRGFRIAPVSQRNLAEITATRADLDVLALGLSIGQGDLEWEGRVLSALHQLNRVNRDPGDPASLEAWERAHAAFHAALIDACGRPMLLGFCRTLHNLNDRYRRMLIRRGEAARNVAEDHAAIAQATVARDADTARSLLRRHIERTGENLSQRLRDTLPD